MRAEKQQLSKDIQALLVSSSGAFLISYKGAKVSEFSALRKELRGVGSECHVVPNRILRKSAAALDIQALATLKVTGETALVAGGKDPAKTAKVLKEYFKAHKALGFRAGMLDKKMITAAGVEALADLPPREILLAQMLGVMQGVPRQLVTVLNAKVASVLYVLKAIADKKEKAA